MLTNLAPIDFGHLHMSADNVAIPQGSFGTMPFNVFDTGNGAARFNTSTYTLTPRSGPVYITWGQTMNGSGNPRRMRILKNGATEVAYATSYDSSNGNESQCVTAFDIASGTDTYVAQLYKPDGSVVANNYYGWFQYASFGFQRESNRGRNTNHLKYPASFSARLSANQTTTGNNNQILAGFDTVLHDTHGRYDTANKRVIPPKGLTLFGVTVYWDVADANAEFIGLRQNGTNTHFLFLARQNVAFSQQFTYFVETNGTDYFDVIYGSWVNARRIDGADVFTNSFWGITWPYTGGR